jgi:hypothetical protein
MEKRAVKTTEVKASKFLATKSKPPGGREEVSPWG